MHDKTKVEEATGASLLGPFFRENTPRLREGRPDRQDDRSGTEVVLYGRVTNAKGAPLPNAQVTVWQTAADGRYDIQKGIEEIDCRGIFRTDDKGNYLIRTVRPLGYFIPLDGPVGQMVMSQKRARHAARAHPLPDQRARATASSSRRSTSPATSIWTTTWCSAPRATSSPRSRTTIPASPDQGRAQHPLRFQPRTRERRPTGAPAASAAIRAPSPRATARPTSALRRRLPRRWSLPPPQPKKGGIPRQPLPRQVSEVSDPPGLTLLDAPRPAPSVGVRNGSDPEV